MNFTTFNNNNNYLDANNAATLTKKNFLEAAAAFLKCKEHLGAYQAYARQYGPATVQTQVLALWNGRVGLAGAPLLAGLTTDIDNYWKNTVKVQGLQRLTLETNTRSDYWTTGDGLGECPTLETYSKHMVPNDLLAGLKITPQQVKGYASLLQDLAQPYLTKTIFNEFNQNHKQAVKLQDSMPAFLNAFQTGELTKSDGTYDPVNPKWVAIEACANFWIKEIQNIASRSATLQAVSTYAPSGTPETMKRIVSGGEKAFVEANGKVVAQGPTSFERHKWFYFRTGLPGVKNACELEVKLKGAAIDFLLGMAQEVSDTSKATSPFALVKKQNEQNCIGIHEELLSAFCGSIVESIKAK